MLQTTLALFLFLVPLAYSPGPGNLFFAANGARFGFRATIPANVGYHLATWTVTASIGFGFLATIESFPQLLSYIKLAGAFYVFFLAWKILKSGTLNDAEDANPATFMDGIVLLLLNPKAYVIITLMFTQFIGLSDMSMGFSVLLITTIFTLNNMLAFSLWTLLGDAIASFFRSPRSAQKLNLIMGTGLAGVAVWMLLS